MYSLCVQDDSDGMVLLGASVPALGLSNKAVLLEELGETKQMTASAAVELAGTHMLYDVSGDDIACVGVCRTSC